MMQVGRIPGDSHSIDEEFPVLPNGGSAALRESGEVVHDRIDPAKSVRAFAAVSENGVRKA